jgi:hypothetical protein
MNVAQQVYLVAEEMQNGKLTEAQLFDKLKEAGRLITDERQQQVVETILTQKLDADLVDDAMDAVRKGLGSNHS